MPNISWDELSDLKHVLGQLRDEEIRRTKYVQGIIQMIDDLVTKHEEEDE